MNRKIIMTAADIRRTLARVAHEIIERQEDLSEIIMVGVHTRGVPLAKRLSANIQSFEGTTVKVGSLDISFYRDDLGMLQSVPEVKDTDIPADINGKVIILVDDVLFTGRTVRAAMDALIDLGRPKSIKLMALIDRGHREFPIKPDYIGKNIPSSQDEDIQVRLEETDGYDEITIISGAGEDN